MRSSIVDKSVVNDINPSMLESLFRNGTNCGHKAWMPGRELEIVELDKRRNLLLHDKEKSDGRSRGSHLMFTKEFQCQLAEYKLTNRKIELFCELAETEGKLAGTRMKIEKTDSYGAKLPNTQDKYMIFSRTKRENEIILAFFLILPMQNLRKHHSKKMEEIKKTSAVLADPVRDILEKIMAVNGKNAASTRRKRTPKRTETE